MYCYIALVPILLTIFFFKIAGSKNEETVFYHIRYFMRQKTYALQINVI